MGKLSVYDFGRQLLETKDLDPVYVVLHGAKLEDWELQRWLVAYWCFYHVGTASWITEEDRYWKAMEAAAGSKDWPRSPERRHFRGNNARKSVAWLKKQGLEALFDPLTVNQPLRRVMDYVSTWVGFGPWISFKVADMIERLGLARIEFSEGDGFLFDSPKKGAALLYETEQKRAAAPGQAEKYAVSNILRKLGKIKAPPRYERTINVQEVETILCKWKAYMSGRYHVGEDIEAIHKGLMRFNLCPLSQRLLQAGSEAKLW